MSPSYSRFSPSSGQAPLWDEYHYANSHMPIRFCRADENIRRHRVWESLLVAVVQAPVAPLSAQERYRAVRSPQAESLLASRVADSLPRRSWLGSWLDSDIPMAN